MHSFNKESKSQIIFFVGAGEGGGGWGRGTVIGEGWSK